MSTDQTPETSLQPEGRVELTKLYPRWRDETMEAWTDRLLMNHSRTHGTYRQCSIGWHDECSQRHLGAEAECNCICHAPEVAMYTVEGHAVGGTVMVTRAEEGRRFWPPQDGEPDSAWARWMLASSLEDATAKAKAEEELAIAADKETPQHEH